MLLKIVNSPRGPEKNKKQIRVKIDTSAVIVLCLKIIDSLCKFFRKVNSMAIFPPHFYVFAVPESKIKKIRVILP